ncbi:glycoside hydrolase family 31 protein [Rhizopogon salebrosus TDB-379]|nr:glycoside hydrolase family 31 protein [Rhizopogon salebrosus TDB-379]
MMAGLGYTLRSLHESDIGLTAQLTLAGPACNAFGLDILDLTIEVTYQSLSTLHVKVYDTANQQFTILESVIELPVAPTTSYLGSPDLVFNYDATPFAFWITRRSDPDAMPLFDTRASSRPPTPIPSSNASDPSTAFDDQYLQVTSALPYGTNIYGLGEIIASSGCRRDIGTDGGVGTIQTHWSRDIQDPIDENMYGSHPIYLEHRYNATTGDASSSVFLLSAAGSDILLQTPQAPNILDFYFSGPTDAEDISQYGSIIGYPAWQPAWGFGFHLCKWRYHNLSDDKENVAQMRAADVPLEVQWNDIDLYHAYRDFTTDPVSFPADELRAFIQELAANHQHYIHIVDAGIAVTVNSTDVIRNPDGSLYIGEVWPGYTVFADRFSENILSVWTEGLKNWSNMGVEFSGIWLDMNEPSSFCGYSCGSGANYSALAPLNVSARVITGYPEWYDNIKIWGPSGNMTINGTSTYSCAPDSTTMTMTEKRGVGAGGERGIDLNSPPYAIHNGFGGLSQHTVAINATHYGGYAGLDVHNMFGLLEDKTTYLTLQSILPGKRPFLISRSTFPSSGKWSGHWLCDNYSKWQYMYLNIQGVLQFRNNTDEELCNRWMQLSAFMPFYRSHNTYGAIPQEPYRWPSVAYASRIAIAAKYALLPYWYTLFASASMAGLPPVKALFFEFPNEPELFTVDRQCLVGNDVLVTPVLTLGATTRDWYTHAAVNAASGRNMTLDAPLSHINVHIRDNSALLLHQEPGYTIYETREGPYALLVSLNAAGMAFGTAYVDDSISFPPGPSQCLTRICDSEKLETITVLGVQEPAQVTVQGWMVQGWTYEEATEELVVSNASVDLNGQVTLSWR